MGWGPLQNSLYYRPCLMVIWLLLCWSFQTVTANTRTSWQMVVAWASRQGLDSQGKDVWFFRLEPLAEEGQWWQRCDWMVNKANTPRCLGSPSESGSYLHGNGKCWEGLWIFWYPTHNTGTSGAFRRSPPTLVRRVEDWQQVGCRTVQARDCGGQSQGWK